MGTNYKHLSCEERTMVQLSLEQGCTLRTIARSVQRAPSSISCELKRNGWSNPATAPRKRGRPVLAGGRLSLTLQRNSALLRWQERCDARRAWLRMARCGVTSSTCCGNIIHPSRARAYCGGCTPMSRLFRSATRPSTPRFTPCRVASCALS